MIGGTSAKGFVVTNSGTIKDIIMNVDWEFENANTFAQNTGTVAYALTSTGVIDGFVINILKPFHVGQGGSLITYNNLGTIQNGWMYGGPVISVDYGEWDDKIGDYIKRANYYRGAVGLNDGKITNIFNQVDAVVGKERIANFSSIAYNQKGTAKDCAYLANYYEFDPYAAEGYQLSTIKNLLNFVYSNSDALETSNLVNFAQYLGEVTDKTTGSRGELQWLWDHKWYDSNLNSKQGFDVYDLVTSGYYPQIKMSQAMEGKQPYKKLPTVVLQEQDMTYTYVESQTLEDAIVVLTINNPQNYKTDNVVIEGLTTEVIGQGWDGTLYRVKVRVSNPTKFYSKYNLASIRSYNEEGSSVKTTYGPTSKYGIKTVDAEFYRSIYSVSDWGNLRADPSQNFRLMNDIDFKGVTDFKNLIYVNLVFSGKFDGGKYEDDKLVGQYTLSNITTANNTQGSVFSKVSGNIKNLIVDNFNTVNHNPLQDAGFIGMTDGAVISNVHIRNSKIIGAINSGGLIGITAKQTKISNSSVADTSIIGLVSDVSKLSVGGLIGSSNNSSIERSYFDNVIVDGSMANLLGGAGGIVGVGRYSSIKDAYATGKVSGTDSYTAGIMGQTTVACTILTTWNDMEVISQGNNVTSISNVSDLNSGSIKNNVSFSGISSKFSDATGVSRIVNVNQEAGNKIENNYAYNKQLLNGKSSNEALDANFLIGKEELKSRDYWTYQIQFGENFAYDNESVDITGQVTSKDISEGYLPMLLNLDGTLVYGQRPHQYRADLSYVQNQAEYNANTYDFTVSLTLNHESYTVLNGFSMEGATNLEYSYSKDSNNPNYTTFEIIGKLQNAWDVYTLNIPLENAVTKAKTQTTAQIKFDSGPVYKNIENRVAWNQYLNNKRNTYENILIVGDIDFTNFDPKTDVLDIMINRLNGQIKADNTLYKIANIDFFSRYSGQSPFSKVTTVSNIAFDNIYIKDAKPTNTLGVIKYLLGTMDNVSFDNLKIEFDSGSIIGAIGNLQGSSIRNVRMKNFDYKNTSTLSKTTRTSYIGGLFGLGTQTAIIDKVTVEGDCLNGVCTNTIFTDNGDYAVSGLFGLSGRSSKLTNIHISGLSLISQNNVSGYSRMQGDAGIISDSSISNSVIKSIGANAYGVSEYSGQVLNVTVDNILVEAYALANGITNITVSNSTIKNSTIRSLTTEASGIGSILNSTNNTVNNCLITAENINNEPIAYAGGLKGDFQSNGGHQASNNTIIDSVIQANGGRAGGLFGSSKTTGVIQFNKVINTKIKGKDYVGGIIGQSDNIKTTNFNTIENSEISGGNYIGGILGSGGVLSATGNIIDSKTKISGTGSAIGGIAGFQKYVDQVATAVPGLGKQNIVGATITGADYVGGFYGIFEIGASLSDWPQNNGVNIGIPTEIIPGSAFKGMIFTGTINGKGRHQSYVANGLNKSDLEGSSYVGIYENAQMNNFGYAKDDSRYTPLIDGVSPINVPKTLTIKQLADSELYRYQLLDTTESNYSTSHMLYTGKQELVVTKTKDGLKIENVLHDGLVDVQLTANRVTKNSYAKDGLVTWFDGRNNAGFNQQNSEAVIWKNLVGPQDAILKNGTKELVAPLNELRFDNNSLVFNTINKNYYADVANLEDVLVNGAENYSFEIAFDAELDPFTTAAGYGSLLSISKLSGKALAFGVNGASNLFYIGEANTTSPSKWNEEKNITLSYIGLKVDEENNIASTFADGNKTVTRYPHATGVSMTSMQIGTGAWSGVANRNLYSIRVYDRRLTEVEVKQNNRVDQLIYRTYKDKLPSNSTVSKEVTGGTLFISNAELASLNDIGALTVEIDNQSVLIDYASMQASELVLIDDTLTKIQANSVIEGSPKIKVDGATGLVTWYRVLDYAKTGMVNVAEVEPSVYTSIAGRGYYYCEDSTGKQSDVIFIKDGVYMPYTAAARVIINGSEGYTDGKPNDVNDNWYQGGIVIPGYESLVENHSNRSRNISDLKMDAAKSEMEKSFSKYGYRIYASDVDKINLEFKDLSMFDENDRIIVKQENDVIMNERVSQLVYSFAYDYQTPVSIEIEQKDISIFVPLNPSNIVNSIMTYHDNFYYLQPQGISTKENIYKGQYIHMMNGKALSVDQSVLELDTSTIVGTVKGITKLDEQIPLYISSHGEQYLRTYIYHTEFVEGSTIFNKQGLFVSKKQNLINLPSDGSVLISGFIKDLSNDKDIFGVVSGKGKLLDMTGMMNIPSIIETKNIKEMTHNLNTNESIVLIRYNNGAISGFNYVTGEVLELVQPTEINTDLLDYIAGSIDSWIDGIPVFASSYNETLLFSELIEGNSDIVYNLSNFKNDNNSEVMKYQAHDNLLTEKDDFFNDYTKGQIAAQQAQAANQKSLLIYNEEKGYYEVFEKDTYLKEKAPINQETKIEELQKQGKLIDINKPSRSSDHAGFIRADYIVIGIASMIFGLLSYFLVIKAKKRKGR